MKRAPRFLHMLLLPAAFTGCGPTADMDATEPIASVWVSVDRDASRLDYESGTSKRIGTLFATSPSGNRVALVLHPDPPVPGPLRLDFALPAGRPPATGLSVDVVAPQMPAHGILRYPVPGFEGDRVSVDIDIPMEGIWGIYLNLDHGPDAAAFEIEVEADPSDAREPTPPHTHLHHAEQH